nr:reverse transcriptase domain-containing protein [Tanacetum cinerariifolium]
MLSSKGKSASTPIDAEKPLLKDSDGEDVDVYTYSFGVDAAMDFKENMLKITALTDMVKELVLMNKANQQAFVKAVEETCVTCGGPHPYYECLATDSNTFNAYAATGTYNQGANPRGDLKAITTRSGVAYDGPTIPPTHCPLPKEVERETEKLSLLELTSTRMTLKLANRSVVMPTGVAEDVFVKVRKFYFLADFVVVDYDVDPCVPLILGRPFLRTARVLIDVHDEELTLRVNDEAVTFKVRHTLGYSCNSYDETVHQVNVIDVAYPIIASSFPSFTPFEGGYFILEEIKTCLRTLNKLSNLDDYDFDPEGDIALIKKFLNEDPSSNLPSLKNDDLKQVDVTMTKPSIKEPPKLELKDLPSHLEYAFLEGTDKLPVIIPKELKDEEKSAFLKDDFKPAVQHQRRVNPKIHEVIKKEVIKLLDAGLICTIYDSSWVSPVHCVPKKGGMTVIENEDNELISTRLVMGWSEKCDFMVKEGIVLGHKIYKSEIEVDRAKVDVIAKLPYPTSVKEKELLAVVYAFEKFWPYLVLSKTIVYTDHSDLKYLLAKQDAKPRLLWWILLLQEFNVIIRDKKGAKNLTVDHLSRLENPYEGDLEKKEINETFSLETLGIISSHNDSSIPWFADIVNYHVGNFIVKGMSSQQKKNSLRMLSIIFRTTPTYLGFVRIK